MMVYFKKIALVFMAIIFFTTSNISAYADAATGVVVPQNAKSTFGSIAAAIIYVSATGAYVEDQFLKHGDEIRANAERIYESSSQSVKDSFNASITAAQVGGANWLDMSAPVWDLLQNTVTNVLNGLKSTNVTETGSTTITRGYNSTTFVFKGDLPSLYINGVLNRKIEALIFSFVHLDKYDLLENRYVLQYTASGLGSDVLTDSRDKDVIKGFENIAANIGSAAAAVALWQSHTSGSDTYELKTNVPDSIYDPTLKRALENDIPRMRDAGLVMPQSIPFSPAGDRLLLNPNTGLLTLPDSTPYVGNPTDVTWAVPNPTIVTHPLTGSPTAAFPRADGAVVDVTTGAIVGADTGVINPPVVVPPVKPDLSKPSKGLVFAPILNATGDLTKKFPFSIPFDFLKQLRIFDVSPEAPKIKVNMPLNLPSGINVPADFDIDFKMFDKVAAMSRWFTVIVFDIGLILAIRRLMPD